MKIKLFTIPNLLTLSSLLCGSFAAVSALVYHDLELAFWLTVAAGVFDYCDGFAARLLKCPSAIGVQLDSLSDMVSFGFVPASVLFVLWNDALAADAEPWMRYGGSVLCFVVAAFRRCGWPSSISTKRSTPNSAACPLRPMRCSSLHWAG